MLAAVNGDLLIMLFMVYQGKRTASEGLGAKLLKLA
jgi:hypothetical protein